jgi:cytochrome P450
MKSAFIYGVIWNFLPLGILRKWWYWTMSFNFRRNAAFVANCLVPTISTRMITRESMKEQTEKPLDVLQFAVDQPVPSPNENDAKRHAIRVMQLTFASTGTVTILVYRLVYQAMLYPEYIAPLRAEIADALLEYGSFGDIKMLNSLHLLDSFIRETMRHYPAACFFAQRTAREEVTLDDLKLPAKARIAFPAMGINMDLRNHIEAQVFDGFRFAGREHSARSEGKINAATTDPKFLSYVKLLQMI